MAKKKIKPEEVTEDNAHIYYGLTKKQYDFANEYLKTGNSYMAYKKIYNTKGSRNTISSQASRLLKHDAIINYIDEMKRAAIQRCLDNKRTIDEEKLMNTILSAEELLAWWSEMITSESRSIKVSDRIKCSELLAKAYGIFTQKVEADVNTNQDIVINITNNEDDEE